MTGLQIPAEIKQWVEDGRTDIALFALKGLGIQLHAAQIEAAQAALDAKAKYNLLTWANRAGKTTVIVVIHMHRLFYKLGVVRGDRGDDKARREWQDTAYLTIHVAPLNKLALQAYRTAREITKGVSVAQRDPTGGYRPSPLAPLFAVMKERDESGADMMHMKCIPSKAVCEFTTTEGDAGRLEGATFRFITWDEWPQQEAADKDEAIRHILLLLTGRAADYNAPIFLTGTLTADTEYLGKEWLAYCDDPENPDWWGNNATRVMNPSANLAAIEQARRGLDPEDYARTIEGIPGGAKGRLFPDWLIDPVFIDALPALHRPEEGYEYLHAWDLAIAEAENVGIVFRIPTDWLFSVEKPIVGVHFKVIPGGRTLTPDEILHTIEETYLPYSGRIMLDTTDAFGKGIQRALRSRGYDAHEFDFHARDPRGAGILKDAAIRAARDLLGEGLLPVRDRTGELVKDSDGVVRLDRDKPYGVFRFPLKWHKLHSQLAFLREEDRHQKKDAAMAFLMGAYGAWRMRRAKTTEVRSTPFTVFGRS